EALLSRVVEHRQVDELHRRLTLESSVGAFRQPDRAHAAAAKRTFEHVGPDLHAGKSSLRFEPRFVEEALRDGGLVCGQQVGEYVRGVRALRAHAREKWPAIGWAEIEQLIQ